MVQTFIDTGLPAVAFIPDGWTVFQHSPLLAEFLIKPKLSLKVLKKKMCLWLVLTYSIAAVGQYVSRCVCRLSPAGLEIENEDEKVKKITLKIKDHNVTIFFFYLILTHHILWHLERCHTCLFDSLYQELSAICLRAVVLIQIKHNCMAL